MCMFYKWKGWVCGLQKGCVWSCLCVALQDWMKESPPHHFPVIPVKNLRPCILCHVFWVWKLAGDVPRLFNLRGHNIFHWHSQSTLTKYAYKLRDRWLTILRPWFCAYIRLNLEEWGGRCRWYYVFYCISVYVWRRVGTGVFCTNKNRLIVSLYHLLPSDNFLQQFLCLAQVLCHPPPPPPIPCLQMNALPLTSARLAN